MAEFATLKKLPSAPQIQFCFVLDATGSMDAFIKIVRASIIGIFKSFCEFNLTNCVEIGFIFYRDFSEENPEYIEKMKECKIAITGWKPQPKIEFTDFQALTAGSGIPGGSIYETLDDLSKRCDGGDDYAEDIAGGLRKMLELKWSQSERTTRIAVLITDAPCHGKEFNQGVLDDFEDLKAYPQADIRPLLDQMIEKNINLTIIQINDKTTQMNKVIQDYYEKKDSSYKFQEFKLIEDLKSIMGKEDLPEQQIHGLAQILLEKLQLSFKRYKKNI